MNNLYEKVSYLKGLMDGMAMDTSTNEGKLFSKIIETLEAFAQEMEYLDEDLAEMDEYVDAMDEDLTDLEDDVYNWEEEDFEDLEEEDEFYEMECPFCDEVFYLEEADLLFDENGLAHVGCPACGGIILVNDELDYFAEGEAEEEEVAEEPEA